MLAVVESYFEECIGLFVDYRAFSGNQIVFCQLESPLIVISPRNVRRYCAAIVREPFSRLRAPAFLMKHRISNRGRPAIRQPSHHTTRDNTVHPPAGYRRSD